MYLGVFGWFCFGLLFCLFFAWNNCVQYFVISLLVQDFAAPGVRFVKCDDMQVLEFSQLVRLDFPGRIFYLRSLKSIP